MHKFYQQQVSSSATELSGALLTLAACDLVDCCGAMMTWLSQATAVRKARGAGKCSVTSQPVAGWLACDVCCASCSNCSAAVLQSAAQAASWG
jgi:hypothetical protein